MNTKRRNNTGVSCCKHALREPLSCAEPLFPAHSNYAACSRSFSRFSRWRSDLDLIIGILDFFLFPRRSWVDMMMMYERVRKGGRGEVANNKVSMRANSPYLRNTLGWELIWWNDAIWKFKVFGGIQTKKRGCIS